jgi:RecA-family ATPase
MTKMSSRKSRLIVEFSDCVRERGRLREVTMEFSPYGIRVRLKGMRSSYEISPASVYNVAVLKDVERKRQERKAQSKTRLRGRR